MPSRLLQLRFVFWFVIYLAALAAAQSSPVVRANHKNALPKQHAAVQSAAPLPPVSYAPPIFYSSDGPGGLVAADLNGDGHIDLVVAHSSPCFPCPFAGSLSVLLGDGDGTFQAPITYSAGGYGPVSVAIGDVNGDGHPDLAVSNFCQAPNGGQGCDGGVSILLGNGDGTFQPPVSYGSGGLVALSIAIGDVNSDGHPDLVVANEQHCGNCLGGFGVLLGNGDGTFQDPIGYDSGARAYADGVSIGDFNADGALDLVVSNETDSLGVLLGNGDGTFRGTRDYSSGGSLPSVVAIGDLNGDGHQDLVVANRNEHGHHGYGGVGVLLGNGDGTFQPPTSYKLGSFEAAGVAIADVNGDGHPDVAVANFCYKTNCNYGSVSVLLGNGDGTFPATQTFKIGSHTNSLAIADVNEDGRPDLLVSCDGGSCSTGAVAVLVSLFPSTTTLSSSPNPSKQGQAVTLTATVSSSAPGGPTGTVTFSNGKVSLGKATLNGGVAARTTKKLPVGTLTITASYGGDARSANSLGTTTQTVQ